MSDSKKQSIYTDTISDNLQREYLAAGDYDSRSAIVEKYAVQLEVSTKSVIAHLSRKGVYVKKEYTTKTGAAVVKKEDILLVLGSLINFTEAELDSLAKANKSAIGKIVEALKATNNEV